MKLTGFLTRSASDTYSLIHHRDIARGGQHRRAISVRLHRAATACTAVADGIEPSEHGVFEERVMNMPSGVLGSQNVDRLSGSNVTRSFRMMFQNETRERFSHDEADIERRTGIPARCAARALKDGDVVRMFEDNVPRCGIWNDMLRCSDADIGVDSDKPGGGL